MRKFKTKNFLYALLAGGTLAFGITGCKKPTDNPNPQKGEQAQIQSVTYAENGGPTVLGEQYNNPYTPANMQAAQIALEQEDIYSPVEFSITTTHYYVKFFPQDLEELTELMQDTTLILSDYPLDYEIVELGNWYREPGLPDDVPTPQYASVRKGYSFNPNISYDILSELYIPEEDPNLINNPNNPIGGREYTIKLLGKAFELAEVPGDWYFDENFTEWIIGTIPPTGTIKIYDSRLGQNIPLEGVKVTAKHRNLGWFTTYQGITNATGQYTLNGTLTRDATFTIHFQRADFAIADKIGVFLPVLSKVVRNSSNSNHWSYTIAPGYENMQGHMFRAAYRYYYKDIDGLSRPTFPLFTQVLVAKNAYKKKWDGINYTVLPVLKVSRYKNADETIEFDSDEIFGITIHELAHTAHLRSMNSFVDYNHVDDKIAESWAIAVQWALTNKEYRSLGITDYGSENYYISGLRRPHNYAYQYWSPSISKSAKDYTSVFIDLVDDYNEYGKYFSPLGYGYVDDIMYQVIL